MLFLEAVYPGRAWYNNFNQSVKYYLILSIYPFSTHDNMSLMGTLRKEMRRRQDDEREAMVQKRQRGQQRRQRRRARPSEERDSRDIESLIAQAREALAMGEQMERACSTRSSARSSVRGSARCSVTSASKDCVSAVRTKAPHVKLSQVSQVGPLIRGGNERRELTTTTKASQLVTDAMIKADPTAARGWIEPFEYYPNRCSPLTKFCEEALT